MPEGTKRFDKAGSELEIISSTGKVAGSISGKTSYLINNDVNSSSSKNMSAKKLGVPIISEDAFIEMFSLS